MSESKNIKEQILNALSHPEASDGLYFRNFTLLHEEDERDPVHADEIDLLDALQELIKEGKVQVDDQGNESIFHLG